MPKRTKCVIKLVKNKDKYLVLHFVACLIDSSALMWSPSFHPHIRSCVDHWQTSLPLDCLNKMSVKTDGVIMRCDKGVC